MTWSRCGKGAESSRAENPMGMRAKEVAGEDLHDGHVNYGHDYGSDGYI